MFYWLIHLVLDALVLLIAANMMSSVEVKNFKTALIVALIIGVLSFFIGWFLTSVLNILTLGLFYFTGLGIVTRVVANAIVIRIADKVNSGFRTRSFGTALILAILIAVIGSLVDTMFLA